MINQTVMAEVMQVVAQHYADKIKASGIIPTEQEVQQAMQNNWEKVSGEIAEIYSKSMEFLTA